MANEAHLAILRRGVKEWNRWRKNHPLAKYDLRKPERRTLLPTNKIQIIAKVTLADLSHSVSEYDPFSPTFDLSDSDLRGVDLANADLRGVDLSEANLRGANLSYAHLERANLSKADLRDANLSHGSLRRANLRETKLDGVDLREADISESNLSQTDLRQVLLASENDFSPTGHFLDLATCEGIESARLRPGFLEAYIERVFCFANREVTERDYFSLGDIVSTALKRIRSLRLLLRDSEPPPEIVDLTREISAELIRYLAKATCDVSYQTGGRLEFRSTYSLQQSTLGRRGNYGHIQVRRQHYC
jgi:uncharacterized protein YjbI with pentapeptide repeats